MTVLFAGLVDLTTVLRKIGFKEHRLRFVLLAPRRDTPKLIDLYLLDCAKKRKKPMMKWVA